MFGSNVTFKRWFVGMQELLEKSPQLPSSKAQLLMIEKYHEDFGIADYNSPEADNRPLMHVAMHPAEDPITGSSFFETCKRFSDLDLGSIWHLSLKEFLELPHDTCEMLFEIAKERREREVKAMKKNVEDAATRNQGNQPE